MVFYLKKNSLAKSRLIHSFRGEVPFWKFGEYSIPLVKEWDFWYLTLPTKISSRKSDEIFVKRQKFSQSHF